jgi:hypothetical protein
MLTISYNKFNVINNSFNKEIEINYDSIIKNYIENYFESEINIYHPDYLYQLIWNNKIDEYKIIELFNNSMDEYVIHLKQNIRQNIKKDNFSLNSLNQLITKFNFKISKLLNILNLKNSSDKIFIEKLLSDPILICFIESETENIDCETISEIKILCSIIKTLSNEYTWFLKLIGNTLKNKIPLFNYNIPDVYKQLYQLNFTIEYITKIKNVYKFVNNELHILIAPLIEVLKKTTIELIPLCNFNQFVNLINNSLKKILNIIKNDDFMIEVKKNVTLYLSNNNIDYVDDEIFKEFLNVLSISKRENIIDSYYLLIFEDEKIILLLLDFIDNYINDNNIFIKNIISLLSNIKNKDIFIDNYHKLLIKRLLSGQTNVILEKIIIDELLIVFGKKVSFKIEKVINDYINSYNDVQNYKINNSIIFDNITTSFSNWNINYSQGYVNFDNNNKGNLSKLIKNYDNYYDKIYSNKRKLIWLLQYGEVNVTFLGNIELKLLPIQLLVLELFDKTEQIKLNDVKTSKFFSNYSDKFKDNIINSLITGGILILKEGNLTLSSSIDIEINYINIFINSEHYNRENIFINTAYEIAHNRDDIIKTIINHNLKLESKNKEDLYNIVKRDIKVFEVDEGLFTRSIDSMIKFDYIKYENNIYTKLLY